MGLGWPPPAQSRRPDPQPPAPSGGPSSRADWGVWGGRGLEGAGIVVGAGERQVAARTGEAGRLLEQLAIVAFDPMQALQQVTLEGVAVGIAKEGRDRRDTGLVVGQCVRLLIVDHLQ